MRGEIIRFENKERIMEENPNLKSHADVLAQLDKQYYDTASGLLNKWDDFRDVVLSYEDTAAGLTDSIEEKAYSANNSIECFFIERTKHFLRSNGLVGIVLPSSILSNGNLYIKTRELLFANFNIKRKTN